METAGGCDTDTPLCAKAPLPPRTPCQHWRAPYLTECAVLLKEERKIGSSRGTAQASLESPPQRLWRGRGPSVRCDLAGPSGDAFLGSSRLPPPSWEQGHRGPGLWPCTPLVAKTCSSEESQCGAPGWPSRQRPGSGRSCPHRNLRNVFTGRSSSSPPRSCHRAQRIDVSALSRPVYFPSFQMKTWAQTSCALSPRRQRPGPEVGRLAQRRHSHLSHECLHVLGLRSHSKATKQGVLSLPSAPRPLITRIGGDAQSWGLSLSPEDSSGHPGPSPSRLEHFYL